MNNKPEEIILLIEDNPGDVRLIKELLREIMSFKYQLVTAGTLKDGCKQIKKQNIILILLDLNLPDSAGKQTFDTIVKYAQHIPIVTLTGLQDEELSISLIKEGAQDYIFKHDLNNKLLGKTIQYAIERKRSQNELQASKEFLNNIINSVASPIFVKDDKHKFYLVNNAFCSLLNLPMETIIGSTDNEYFPEEQTKVFIAKDKEVFKTGKENSNEETLTDGKGKIRNIITRKNLYTDPAGNKFLVGIINDITARKQSEEMLRKSEETHRMIIETAMDGFWMVDMRGNLLHVNDAYCRISGYNREKLLTMNISDLEAKESVNDIAARIKKVAKQKEMRFESIHRRQNGQNIALEVSIQFLPLDGGRMVVFFHDVVERNKLAAALKLNIDELQKFHRLIIERDRQNTELEKEINVLLKKTGKEDKYVISPVLGRLNKL